MFKILFNIYFSIGINVFDYIDRVHVKIPVFYNFMYSLDLQQTVLRPYCNVSDFQIWEYYLEEELRHGPSYDYELILLEREEEFASESLNSGSSQRENLIGGYDCMSRNDLNSCTHNLYEIAR